jgi:hypothetical protein
MAISESAVLSALGSLAKGAWNWIQGKRRVNAEIQRFHRQIMSTESTSRLSEILVDLKILFQEHEELFMRPHLQEFYDKWPGDGLLDLEGTHSRLFAISDGPDGIRDLKADTVRLLHP